LQREIEEWTAGVEGDFLFPTSTGSLHRRYSNFVQGVLTRARAMAAIPDLTFRACRTTFSTLYDGDPKDLQDTLGHKTVDMTLMVYRKPQAARQKSSVEELDARLSSKVVEMPAKQAAG
jgi:integrase